MFSKTKDAFIKLTNNLKKIYHFFIYCLIFFTTLYFIYALISKTGIFVVNLILASMFIAYSIFEIVTFRKKNY